jgi:ketosteroid isomerase-like protein
MPQTASDDRSLADQVRRAFNTHDLDTFGALLSHDVRWGDADHPRGCRNRSDVLATFARLLDSGVDGSITELVTGTDGILCALRVEWPTDDPRAWDRSLYHVYLVRDGRICEIQRYDDRASAAGAAGVS